MMRTIDVHTHVYLPRYINLLRARTAVPRIFTKNNSERLVILPNEDSGSTSNGRPIGPVYSDPKLKLKFMDSHNISTSILSLANPWLDFLPANEAEPIASLLNDDLQQMCLGEERFKGFGVLPTISAEGSMNELENIKSHSELVGVIMGTHGLGKGLDDVLLEPVFKKAADLNLVIFLHPHYSVPSELFGPLENGHVLPLALGFPFETTIAVSRMILSGVFDRIPHLKMMIAHSGGTLPFLAGRLDSCVLHDPLLTGRLAKAPSDYLKMLYYDAVAYHPAGLQCAIDLVGSKRIMFGTDHPFFPPLDGKSDVWESVETNRDAIVKMGTGVEGMMGGNASRIFRI